MARAAVAGAGRKATSRIHGHQRRPAAHFQPDRKDAKRSLRLTVFAWRIAPDTPDYTADDLTGEGARQSGGRWNRVGTPMVYASGSIELACLETIVHLRAGDLPLNRYLVQIELP